MKVLVLEYITGGGLVEKPFSGHLAEAGDSMLQALLADLISLPALAVRILRDDRLPPLAIHGERLEIDWVGSCQPWLNGWQAALAWADTVWIVAPETGGILYRLAQEVLGAKKQWLGCHPDAIHVTADKFTTGALLAKAGIESIPSRLVCEFEGQFDPPWIVKPRGDVGCEGIALVEARSKLADFAGREWLIQPYVQGEAISLSAVFADGEGLVLTVNRQHLAWGDGFLKLEGCTVNIGNSDSPRYQRLCSKIAEAIPGLWGYVGIDLIRRGEQLWVVEINPRLTLSYTGTGRALNTNVAEWILLLASGRVTLAELALWRDRIDGKTIRVTA